MPTRTTALAAPEPEPPANGTPTDPMPAVDPLEDLGLKLAIQRARRRMSRTDLAERIGCSYEAVLSAEIGEQPSLRTFWTLADNALHANGKLLAAADRASQRPGAAKRVPQRQPPERAHEAVKLARYRQVQRTNRVFADRLSTTAIRRQRCPHMAKSVAHQQTRIRHELTALITTIRTLLRRPDFTPDDVFTDLWQTLLTHDPLHASFLSTAAVMELAQSRT